MAAIDLSAFRSRRTYISEKRHPRLPLILWNYTRPCLYDAAWDAYTTLARGLITDLAGEIVAHPFAKFFNLNEHPSTLLEHLPADFPTVYVKYDGSLGIQYSDGDDIAITTRGHWTSAQAIWATGWIRERFVRHDFDPAYTYLWEIIYPDNQVIVDYGDRAELILIGVIDTETGADHPIDIEARRLGVHSADIVPFPRSRILADLEASIPANEEGYVLRYPNGLRVKVKGAEYREIARIAATMSPLAIWDLLRNGRDLDEIVRPLPARIRTWAHETGTALQTAYRDIVARAAVAHARIRDLSSRKDQAIVLLDEYRDISSVVFQMLDGKSISDRSPLVWNLVKPRRDRPYLSD